MSPNRDLDQNDCGFDSETIAHRQKRRRWLWNMLALIWPARDMQQAQPRKEEQPSSYRPNMPPHAAMCTSQVVAQGVFVF